VSVSSRGGENAQTNFATLVAKTQVSPYPPTTSRVTNGQKRTVGRLALGLPSFVSRADGRDRPARERAANASLFSLSYSFARARARP